MHHNKGKTIAACLKARTDYAKNPEKTDDGALVTAYACDPQTVHSEFLLAKREYRTLTGREQEHDVIAYQVRQSFRPGEVTPEDANCIGYEFATRFLKGAHAFFVATHIDKAHIHNHIIWNSTALDCTHKFRDFKRSAEAVRRLSDTICLENGISIVEDPKRKGMHYGKWLGNAAQPSHRDNIRADIDSVMAKRPADISAFFDALIAAGYEIKQGKNPALRRKEQQRFIRMDTLGEGYTVEDLQAAIAGSRVHAPRKKAFQQNIEKPVNLLVDIQAALSAGKGVAYERWAKVYNLKQMAQTINYLSEHSLLNFDTLETKTDDAVARYDDLSSQIKATEHRLAENSSLRTHIVQYIKTRDAYIAYRKNGYSKKYLAAHEGDILLHKAAKKHFDDLGLKKLPTVAHLKTEHAELMLLKKDLYAEYQNARSEMKELLAAKHNVSHLLDTDSKNRDTKNHEASR